MTEIENLVLANQYTIMRILKADYLRWHRDKVGLDWAKEELQKLGIDEQIRKTHEALGKRTD